MCGQLLPQWERAPWLQHPQPGEAWVCPPPHIFDRCTTSLGSVYISEARGSSSDYWLLLALKFYFIHFSAVTIPGLEGSRNRTTLPFFFKHWNFLLFIGLHLDSCYGKSGNWRYDQIIKSISNKLFSPFSYLFLNFLLSTLCQAAYDPLEIKW